MNTQELIQISSSNTLTPENHLDKGILMTSNGQLDIMIYFDNNRYYFLSNSHYSGSRPDGLSLPFMGYNQSWQISSMGGSHSLYLFPKGSNKKLKKKKLIIIKF